MRAGFTLALLVPAAFYAILAFNGLNFLSPAGRIGPGFFPQIIGALLVAMCLYSLVSDLEQRDHDEPVSRLWLVVAVVAALSGLLVAAIYVLGALPGMILFMLLALSYLNRGRHLQNALLGAALPIAIFVLFRYGLNATMPDGILGLSL